MFIIFIVERNELHTLDTLSFWRKTTRIDRAGRGEINGGPILNFAISSVQKNDDASVRRPLNTRLFDHPSMVRRVTPPPIPFSD